MWKLWTDVDTRSWDSSNESTSGWLIFYQISKLSNFSISSPDWSDLYLVRVVILQGFVFPHSWSVSSIKSTFLLVVPIGSEDLWSVPFDRFLLVGFIWSPFLLVGSIWSPFLLVGFIRSPFSLVGYISLLMASMWTYGWLNTVGMQLRRLISCCFAPKDDKVNGTHEESIPFMRNESAPKRQIRKSVISCQPFIRGQKYLEIIVA